MRRILKDHFRLNEYDVLKYAHDPSMMWDPVSEKYYSYCTDVYAHVLGIEDKIGIPVRVSEDLIEFQYVGIVLSPEAIEEGRDNGNYPQTVNFWAPYTEYVSRTLIKEYRMYYSATKAFGSSESRIWLATSNSPTGPFVNRGVVADTWGTNDTYPNAIDAHVIWEGDRSYLIYGSFFGGIFIKELDSDTGLPLDGNPKTLGKCIARKSNPPVIDGPEGASAIYVPQTGYYYLFQSYGWLGDNYDIRVGRSKEITGPYVDIEGKDLVSHSLGQKLAGSYEFLASNPKHGECDLDWSYRGFRGPGHGVPFLDPNTNQYFFVHHIRDGARVNEFKDENENRLNFRKHYMMIRPMFFINGWPVLGPENYSGEDFNSVDKVELCGDWEIIYFNNLNNNLEKSKIISLQGFSDLLEKCKIYKCYDYENSKISVVATGYTEKNVCFWAKKR